MWRNSQPLINACQCFIPANECVPFNHPASKENDIPHICVSVQQDIHETKSETILNKTFIQNVTDFSIEQEQGLSVIYITPTYTSPLVDVNGVGENTVSISTELISQLTTICFISKFS